MSKLHIDFETKSAVDLKTAGADKYARDPSTDIWCMVYRFDDEPVGVWEPGVPLPQSVMEHVMSGDEVVAHNDDFELLIWNHILVPRYGAPILTVEQCDCTMKRALACALPGSLDRLGTALTLTTLKDIEGKRLMMRMARPRSVNPDGTFVWWDGRDKVNRLIEYCKTDVEVEVAADKKLPKLIPYERELKNLDYYINRRGVKLDIPTILKAQEVVADYRQLQNERLAKLTGYAVSSAQAVSALRYWMESKGVFSPDLTAPTVQKLLSRDDIPPDVYDALQIREELSRSSVAKLDAMLASADTDGRARGLFAFSMASTRRWAGRRVQPQNLTRPHWKDEEYDEKIAQTIRVLHGPNPLQGLLDAFGSVMDPISSCLRAMFVAERGHKLVAADYSSIEARVLAWLAGETKRLEVFRSGADIYVVTAAEIYGVPEAEVTKPLRQIGKIAELAMGYQGGVNAFLRFANAYSVEGITEEFAGEIKDKWRGANKKIVRFWYALEAAAKSAIRNPGKVYEAGSFISFRTAKDHLLMRLPGGGYLFYPWAKVETLDGREKITFYGHNSFNNQWGRLDTYGGKLAENATQAVARDIQANGLLVTNQRALPTVLHVHDEIVAEVPGGSSSRVQDMEAAMTALPAWARGLPIDAKGWEGERYRK